MSVGLLLLRVLLAALLFGHATQKLRGWFGGSGRAATGAIFEQWGFRPGARMVLVAGLAELLGAASLAAGLLTPGGCALVVGTMTVAAWRRRSTDSGPNGAAARCRSGTAPRRGARVHRPGSLVARCRPGLRWSPGYAWGIAASSLGLLASAVPSAPRVRGSCATRRTTAPQGEDPAGV